MINEMGFSTYHEVISYELRAALTRYFEKWDEIKDKPEADQPLYDSTIEQYRISVIVLCSALVECVINFYLSTKCDANKFKKLDRLGFFKKWAEAPKEFVAAYDLSPKSELAVDLEKLINRRNVIVHAKPTMSIDGDNRHQGNNPAVALDENDFIGRCASLPLRLIDNLLQYDSKAYMELNTLRNPCGMVAGIYSKWQGKCEVAAKFPRELILEIMQQGYNRKIAVECAIQFRGKPPVLEKAEYIIVRFMGKEIAKLKPLKFYNMV
jgi:hypothetical protein